jgi:hypothetical protein
MSEDWAKAERQPEAKSRQKRNTKTRGSVPKRIITTFSMSPKGRTEKRKQSEETEKRLTGM